MSRSFEKSEFNITDCKHVTVRYLQCRKFCLRLSSIHDRSTCPLREFDMAADKIRVGVRFDHILYLLAVGFGFVQVLLDIPLRVYHGGLVTRADVIRRVCQTTEIELPEVHIRRMPPRPICISKRP